MTFFDIFTKTGILSQNGQERQILHDAGWCATKSGVRFLYGSRVSELKKCCNKNSNLRFQK